MQNNIDAKYEVVIIGAGLGGLLSGIYLAKSGIKTLILERHNKVGGYCGSFRRGGRIFDIGIHSFGSLRPNGGLFNKVYTELGLDRIVKLNRINPADILYFPSRKISLWNEYNRTIDELERHFPNKKDEIKKFLRFIKETSVAKLYTDFKSNTFNDLLCSNFGNDESLKSVFSILLEYMGLSPFDASAVSATILLREHVLDGGYYPEGGMQCFADQLAALFMKYGGRIALSSEVREVHLVNNKVAKIIYGDSEVSECDYLICASDPLRFFSEQLKDASICARMTKKMKHVIIGASACTAYVGFNRSMGGMFDRACGLWYMPDDNVYEYYQTTRSRRNERDCYMLVIPTSLYEKKYEKNGTDAFILFAKAAYRTKEYWLAHKDKKLSDMVDLLEKFQPGCKKYIDFMNIATPQTYERYTCNAEGSIRGWASVPGQINLSYLVSEHGIGNLFFAGHWAPGVGTGGVTLSATTARNASGQIIKQRSSRCSITF